MRSSRPLDYRRSCERQSFFSLMDSRSVCMQYINAPRYIRGQSLSTCCLQKASVVLFPIWLFPGQLDRPLLLYTRSLTSTCVLLQSCSTETQANRLRGFVVHTLVQSHCVTGLSLPRWQVSWAVKLTLVCPPLGRATNTSTALWEGVKLIHSEPDTLCWQATSPSPSLGARVGLWEALLYCPQCGSQRNYVVYCNTSTVDPGKMWFVCTVRTKHKAVSSYSNDRIGNE